MGPVRFVAAVREPDDRIALLLEGPLKAAPIPPYRVMADGLSVTDQRRPEEGIFRIAVVLEQDGLRDVFEVLAADVVEVATRASNAEASMETPCSVWKLGARASGCADSDSPWRASWG